MKTIILLSILLLTVTQTLQANCEVPGKVIAIIDGDSIKILDNAKQQHEIRILGIDAPEKGQPYSKAAKKYLNQLIAKKTVCLEPMETDKYQRTVAKVLLAQVDIGLALISPDRFITSRSDSTDLFKHRLRWPGSAFLINDFALFCPQVVGNTSRSNINSTGGNSDHRGFIHFVAKANV